jgi:predicted SAM-dependent methyltransferase
MPVDELRKQYPELRKFRLVPVDVIDDGEVLSTISDGSLDFVVANHFLEHCENPLGAVRSHLRVLNPGGVLYYAVPDKTKTFDIRRPVTGFDHLVKDDVEGPAWSREQHFREWVELVSGISDREQAEREVKRLVRMSYSIHFHVWDESALSEFATRIQAYLGNACYLAHFERNHTEFILVLKKKHHGIAVAPDDLAAAAVQTQGAERQGSRFSEGALGNRFCTVQSVPPLWARLSCASYLSYCGLLP